MAAKVFSDLLQQSQISGISARADGANQWFRNKAKEVRKADVKRIMQDSQDRYRTAIVPGNMYMFYYDPKLKNTLPYYDTFPLIFPLSADKNSFLGINFHYLNPVLRAKLLDALYEHVSNDKMNDTTKMKISYDILKSASKYRYFKPCIKRYLKSHVRSRFVKIYPNEWDFAVMLQTQNFEKAPAHKVWADSRKIIGL